jgi:hypothetical protein
LLAFKLGEHFFSGALKDAGGELIDDVHTRIVAVVETLLADNADILRFPKVEAILIDAWSSSLDAAKKETESLLTSIISAEAAQVYTQNHYYMDTIAKIRAEARLVKDLISNGEEAEIDEASVKKAEDDLEVDSGFIRRYADVIGTSNEKQALMDLQVSLHVYSKVLMKRLFDIIPIIVRHGLVIKPHEMFNENIGRACSDEVLEVAFVEDQSLLKKRASLEASIERLKGSQAKLRAIR